MSFLCAHFGHFPFAYQSSMESKYTGAEIYIRPINFITHSNSQSGCVEMNTYFLSFLLLLAIVAAQEQPAMLGRGQHGWDRQHYIDEYQRRQRENLLQNKMSLLEKIGELRDSIFRQQLRLAQYQRDKAHLSLQHASHQQPILN